MMAKSGRVRRARKEAFAATRSHAAGKSRKEIGDWYAAVLRERGLNVPAQHVLDAVVDGVNGNYLRAAHVLGESLARMGKGSAPSAGRAGAEPARLAGARPPLQAAPGDERLPARITAVRSDSGGGGGDSEVHPAAGHALAAVMPWA